MMSALSRNSGTAALVVAVIALVFSVAGVSAAVNSGSASTKPKKYGLLLLNKKKQYPASVIPKVRAAKNADKLGGQRLSRLNDTCAADSANIGTFCLMGSAYRLQPDELGKNNYFFATKKCTTLGGWLPSAEELLGAVEKLSLHSSADDNLATASIDEDPTDGIKDRREMTSTLVTTAAGSSAAGTQGVSSASRGNPRTGEPDPVPLAANPQPSTLQYVTVYDNHDNGGFAGSKPVGEPETFRCAFNKSQARNQRKPLE